MTRPPSNGLLVAAPSSGSGKTCITLGLLGALRARAIPVRGAKSGPDYIDPRYHEAATGQPCMNLDAWAMSQARITALAQGDGMLVVEGAMGLFDGAPPDGKGSCAGLARVLNLPVVLVIDAGRMAQSVAPLVAGFAHHDPQVKLAGVILNRVGSPRHDAMLRRALAPLGLPVLGSIPRNDSLSLPARHLGLVQASEHADLEAFLTKAADLIEATCDIPRIAALAAALPGAPTQAAPGVLSSYKRIAIADDAAFGFSYPHLKADWNRNGTQIIPFSPLANEAVPEAELVILPGGYPELHAGTLAKADRFLGSLRNAAQTTDIYGECGGYMVLGETLTDKDGTAHNMAGLLPLATSFADRRLHLGYRTLTGPAGTPFEGPFTAHEFHYATTRKASGSPLFDARDAEGRDLAPMGLRQGRVCGSFAHLIDAL